MGHFWDFVLRQNKLFDNYKTDDFILKGILLEKISC